MNKLKEKQISKNILFFLQNAYLLGKPVYSIQLVVPIFRRGKMISFQNSKLLQLLNIFQHIYSANPPQ